LGIVSHLEFGAWKLGFALVFSVGSVVKIKKGERDDQQHAV
jgi:hypothetical protein